MLLTVTDHLDKHYDHFLTPSRSSHLEEILLADIMDRASKHSEKYLNS